jgi:hypothetical protein
MQLGELAVDCDAASWSESIQSNESEWSGLKQAEEMGSCR